MKEIIIAAALSLMASLSVATPGGTNAEGCHDSKKIGWHCHVKRSYSKKFVPVDGTQDARDKRLARECRGRPNAGACEGYAR